MTEAARGYLVRDADSTRGKGAKVDQIYPYTLRGLTEALEEARFRSHSGAPQVLAILGTGNTRVIRRFENGREVPVAPLPRLLAVCPSGSPPLPAARAQRTPLLLSRKPNDGRRGRVHPGRVRDAITSSQPTPRTVSPAVRNKALAAGAERWLRDLPDLVADVEREWSITVGRSYADPTEAFVAEATLGDGTPAVLKLLIARPGDLARSEITVLRLSGGNGCARLLRADEARGALLLERLGSSLHELALPMTQRHEILVSAASRIWRPAPGCGLPTGADHGRRLADLIPAAWEELGRPCSERAIADALSCLARRIAAHDDERAVLVHGDVHQWNALQAAGGGFKLVDPDGLVAEAECDLGVLMREDPVELLHGDPRERARWLAARCGLDATAIWEWGVAERVATGLVLTRIELQPVGRQMLATADHVAG